MLNYKIFCKYPHIRWQNPLDEFNYLQLTFLFPDIFVGKSKELALEYPFIIRLGFDSTLEYTKIDNYWNSRIRILGFGINIKYQNGY